MLHLNQPAASFYIDGSEVYPLRTFLHLKTKLPVSEKLDIYGLGQYSKQATAKQIILGAGIDFKIAENKTWNLSISSRMNDALIFATGIKTKKFELGISYDSNNSKLSNATSGFGGIELSAAYFFNKSIAVNEIPNKKITANKLQDRDKDLVPDHLDECPDTPGLTKYNGCNDKDKDGIYDSIDACPNLFGHRLNKGCPMDPLQDSDEDGLVDKIDDCPFLKGLPEHKGCQILIKME